MIETRKDTNYLMDWDDPRDRINYFRNLRKFMDDLDDMAVSRRLDEVLYLMRRWNIYFIEYDEIPRVNLDDPA